MTNLTVNLPDDVSAELAAASRAANRSPEEVAGELIKQALLARRFAALRNTLLQTLGPDAPDTDEEAFKLVS